MMYGGGIPFRPCPRPSHVYLRPVTADNVYTEVGKIRSLIGDFPFVAVDADYPGVIHHLPGNLGRYDATEARYSVVKANVDELHLLQLGITICDGQGRLPVCPGPNGGVVEFAWIVSFADFDAASDRQAPGAVAFLRSQGMDFEAARRSGVTAEAFAREIHRSGILTRSITWVTYGGLYDAAYLIKTITGGEPLPDKKVDFLGALGTYLGGKVFDVKYMASLLGVEGRLSTVAAALNVPILVPARHLAGRNSLVTCHAFMELRRRFFPCDDVAHLTLALQFDGLRNAAADQANMNFFARTHAATSLYDVLLNFN